MKQISQSKGHCAGFLAYSIFGFNVIVCKQLADDALLSPTALFTIRAIAATLLFWIASCFTKKEKVERSDYGKIFIASMLGLLIPQATFLFAIGMTTSLDASILSALSPIFTMLFATFFLKEPLTSKKISGVALSFIGVIFLLFNSVRLTQGAATTTPLGIILLLCNSISFSCYLGIFRPLSSKYSVVTFMKWMFLFSMIVALPFGIGEIVSFNFQQMPTDYLLRLSFLVICATFISYFLIPVAQQNLRPTVVSLYSYLQPIIACVLSIIFGMDHFNLPKLIAIATIFCGIILVNKSKAKNTTD
ncbi:MAG: DMT family transporter [Bacteroidales bacterium]|nr:DMT family transporter [Bacteroidales bacterium]